MNKIFFIFIFLILLSCKEKFPVQIIDLDSIPLKSLNTEKRRMEEIQNPLSMRFFNNHILFINTANNADAPFYIYSADSLSFINRFGKFGRGPQEIFSYNLYYWETTDSSFFININHYYRTEIAFSKDAKIFYGLIAHEDKFQIVKAHMDN